MKKEKIEKAAKKYAEKYALSIRHISYVGFEDGAKYMAEKMYSEEDMEEAFTNGLNRSFDSDFDRWFEHYEKK